MAWVCVDEDMQEFIFEDKPVRNIYRRYQTWSTDKQTNGCVYLPYGSIKKLIGKELTWSDEPVELKEDWG